MLNQIEAVIQKYFKKLSLDPALGKIELSNRPEMADFQCNGSFLAAKILKKNPLLIAQEIVSELKKSFPLIEFTTAAPGFINIQLDAPTLLELASANLNIASESNSVLIDFGSPNVAKGMHVGHLRSSLIGASLVNIHRFGGHTVTGDNHLGDWGTPLGIVISKIKPLLDFEWTLEAIEALYVAGAKQYKEDPEFKEVVKATTNNLQQGAGAEKSIWQKLIEVTVTSLKKDYAQMGITFDLWLGESHFEKQIPLMLSDLAAKNLISISDGALVLPLEDGKPSLILEKSGGGYLYHTTDLACIKERSHEYNKILYVVDKRQSLHFAQVFSAAQKVGYLPDHVHAEHVAFGTINGSDGKPFKTRDGGVLKLKDLISLMKEAAAKKLDELNVTYSETERSAIIPLVAMGALKFAELKHNRQSDYVFDLDKFVELNGYTGPYVMYAAVRAGSVLAKSNEEFILNADHDLKKEESELVKLLGQFPYVFEKALNKNEPHHLCEYSFKLANVFNNFYHCVPVLKEEDKKLKQHYLWLVNQSFKTLETTLNLLGINLPKKM